MSFNQVLDVFFGLQRLCLQFLDYVGSLLDSCQDHILGLISLETLMSDS